jgi:hypothetical protein
MPVEFAAAPNNDSDGGCNVGGVWTVVVSEPTEGDGPMTTPLDPVALPLSDGGLVPHIARHCRLP